MESLLLNFQKRVPKEGLLRTNNASATDCSKQQKHPLAITFFSTGQSQITKLVTNMAAMEDDVFFDALQKHCKIIESALMSKCNMNNQVREDARQALDCTDNCSSEDVKKIIKAKINPAESKLGVCDLKNIRGNKLLVKCFSENDRDRLLTEIQEKSPELKASVPKRRNPAIIVKNVPNEVKNEDLLKVITEQKILKLL
ncbi:hypothetical protein TNCV_1155651 [Trichonephila clavipes]|nr:hypothetical protein TNCV_1155651 [Trichonephila clavipes]